MNKTNELICAHSILVFTVLLSIGWFGIAGWMPLLEPSMTADEIARHFEDNRTRIRIGVTLVGFGGMFWWSFAAAISTQLKRIEGEHSPFTRLQMAAAGGTAIIIFLEVWLILALTNRSSIDPVTVQLANDFIWLTFVGYYPPGVLQNLAIGTCILTDKNPVKIFPRWVGYANFWFALGFMPGVYIAFFKDGPFAWDGILGFWVIAIAFFVWIGVMWWAVVRAIKQA